MVAVIVFAIIVGAVTAGVGLYALFTSPERKRSKLEVLELSRTTRVESNHLDMFLFINELVALDKYEALFPRTETAEKAKQLVQTYREETTK